MSSGAKRSGTIASSSVSASSRSSSSSVLASSTETCSVPISKRWRLPRYRVRYTAYRAEVDYEGSPRERRGMSPTPIILDVDPGHDDAVAIMLACGAPELELLAVTTVAGNVPLEKTTRNALRILSLIGRPEVPVAAGASSPLYRPLHTAEKIHGESGLDGPEIPDSFFAPDERGAVALIADTLRTAPEPVTLVPVAPLTNVALFLREHPELKERVARISLMGGSIGLGNTTPAAEFNVYVDPEAAREVFECGLPVTMS